MGLKGVYITWPCYLEDVKDPIEVTVPVMCCYAIFIISDVFGVLYNETFVVSDLITLHPPHQLCAVIKYEPVREKTNNLGSELPTRSDTYQAVLSQKMVRGWKFQI